MGLSDLNFIFRFLPIFLLVYFLCPVRFRNLALFLASLLFCALSSPSGAVVLTASVTVNYILLRAMEYRQNSPSWRKAWLAGAVLFHGGLLGYYKYIAPALPPGISFYTFTMLSADIDVYRRAQRPPGSFLEHGTFAVMFPKLLSGPLTE